MARIKHGRNRKTFQTTSEYGIWDISLVGEFAPKDYYGFVYRIINKDNNKMYVGSKCFTEGCGRGKRRKSNWRKYTSSSYNLNADLDKGMDASFEILSLHCTKEETLYAETTLQYKLDVLHAKDLNQSKIYYNGVIAGKEFVNINTEPFSEERRRNIGNNRDYSSEVWGTDAQKLSARHNKDRTWWNDGVKSFFLRGGESKEGLIKGRIISYNTSLCRCCKESFKHTGETKSFCSNYCKNHYNRELTRIKRVGESISKSKNYLKALDELRNKRKKTKRKPLVKKPQKSTHTEVSGIRDNPCNWCGGEIQRCLGRYLYCSESCRLKVKKVNTALRVKKPLEQKFCSLCGIGFESARDAQHLCSKDCSTTYKSKLSYLRRKTQQKLEEYGERRLMVEPNPTLNREELIEFLFTYSIRDWREKKLQTWVDKVEESLK